MALELAERGAHVALLARSVDQLEEAASAVRAAGGVAAVLPADLADPDAVAEAAPDGRQGARAGRHPGEQRRGGPAGRTDRLHARLRRGPSAFAVNVEAPIHLTLALLPSMLDRGWGRIVNVSSGIADHPGAMVGTERLRRHQGRTRGPHPQPGRRAGRQRRDGQRLPARLGRHRHAGVVPRPAARRDRRRPAPAFSGLLRAGRADHARSGPPDPSSPDWSGRPPARSGTRPMPEVTGSAASRGDRADHRGEIRSPNERRPA